MSMPTPPDHRKDVRLAAAAYQAGLAGKWKTAESYLHRLSQECGGEGVTTALIAWCDTYADHATDGQPVGERPNMAFVNTDTGRLDEPGSATVPAKVQWAFRLIIARATMDLDEWDAAIADLPADALEMSQYIYAVLQGLVHTVNGLPRGYARMGRG